MGPGPIVTVPRCGVGWLGGAVTHGAGSMVATPRCGAAEPGTCAEAGHTASIRAKATAGEKRCRLIIGIETHGWEGESVVNQPPELGGKAATQGRAIRGELTSSDDNPKP
jgi:hypothetical protein